MSAPTLDNWLGVNPSGTSFTSIATASAGDLVLIFGAGSPFKPTLADSAGNSYSEVLWALSSGGGNGQRVVAARITSALSPSSTFSSSVAGELFGAISFVRATSVLRATASGQAFASITANAGDLVVGIFTSPTAAQHGTSLSFSTPAGWTMIATGTSGSAGWTVGYIVPTSTGTVTFQALAATNTQNIHTILAFKPVSGGLSMLV